MKALIFGVSGFAGSHLAELLLERGDVEIAGAYRTPDSLHRLSGFGHRLRLMEASLEDAENTLRLVRRERPDWIFNLAGQSNVAVSWKSPRETFESNLTGFLNILEAVKESGLDAKILAAGSADQYGPPPAGVEAIDEELPMRPVSPYGVSKAAMDHIAGVYQAHYGLKVYRARAFNHTGPRGSRAFVTASFASQIAEIEAGRQDPVIWVGNLEARRDFCDVRDVTRAYIGMLEKGRPGEAYNVGSGRDVSIRQMLDSLLSRTNRRIDVQVDANRLRPTDTPVLRANIEKIRRETGWAPRRSLEETLSDLLEYWRGRAKTA